MFIVAAVLTAIASGTTFATVKVVQHRERLRKLARETEHLNVIPTDVRRAAAMSSVGIESGSDDGSPGFDGDGE